MNGKPPAVILDRPQLAENIGAVARVMANFGLDDLRLVAPRDGWPQKRAFAAASGAHWPLEGARVFSDLDCALADLSLVLAATARPRELSLPALDPKGAAERLAAAAASGVRGAFLLGGERAGLTSHDIARCQAIVTIPIDPRFHSLNLAQAAVVLAYEWRLASAPGIPPAFEGRAAPASQEALMGLYGHLEGELDAAGFFHPPEKRASMVRNLRAPLARAELSDQEVSTWRGVVTALSKGRGRSLAKLAAQRRSEPSP